MCHGICAGSQKTYFQKPFFFYRVCSGFRLRTPDLVSTVLTENHCSLREDLKGLEAGDGEQQNMCARNAQRKTEGRKRIRWREPVGR